MIINGKYYVEPNKEDISLNKLFSEMAILGLGRKADSNGLPEGSWTPELLTNEICELNDNPNGVDLRTVQFWFQQNNSYGISPRNIKHIAQIFSCGDPQKLNAWRVKLMTAKHYSKSLKLEVAINSNIQAEKKLIPLKSVKPGFEHWLEEKFSVAHGINLISIMWLDFFCLSMFTIMLGVHSVTYKPLSSINKQVGYFWEPNWTFVQLFFMPLLITTTSSMLYFWRAEGRANLVSDLSIENINIGWKNNLYTYRFLIWTIVSICLFFVFIIQWYGACYLPATSGKMDTIAINWQNIAWLRPEVMQLKTNMILSLCAYFFACMIVLFYLCSFAFQHAIFSDFSQLYKTEDIWENADRRVLLVRTCAFLLKGVYKSTIYAIIVASLLKLNASYMKSSDENILLWIYNDFLSVINQLSNSDYKLNYVSITSFSTYLLVLVAIFVMIYAFVCIAPILMKLNSMRAINKFYFCSIVIVIIFLTLNFIMVGDFTGFSILLFITVVLTTYGVLAPFRLIIMDREY